MLPPSLVSSFYMRPQLLCTNTVRQFQAKVKLPYCDFGLRLKSLSKYSAQGSSMPKVKSHEREENETETENLKIITQTERTDINEGLESIKNMLELMEDGQINISAYDTAWVAMIKDIHGSDTPQFPSTLDWIANNQLHDGSWGMNCLFLAYDRLLNTLACVIALKSWKCHNEKCDKGISFVIENLNKLENERSQHMPVGFEVTFTALLDRARGLGIHISIDSPIIQKIYAKRERKLKRIPKDIMHREPTTLLFSLEGLEGLDLNWEQLLKLKCKDGSFLTSPSSTSCAFMHTKDEDCLQYLTKLVHKFNGAVPNLYPLDIFERLWVADRLRRLGISRYFHPQISDQCINYVKSYWNDKGIGLARDMNVPDLDDTCMAFRLLRLHGHHVSADVFSHFKKGDEFFCYPGQSDEAVTVIYNLYRASQVSFPGEKILEEAKQFAYKFLREKQAANEIFDKWIIYDDTKDLADEVTYGLDVTWYANLPRVETRFYLEQYGGEKDIWIGKVIYRLPYINNNTYLEVAKQDYNNCQALHRCEWGSIQKWHKYFELAYFGIGQKALLRAYFVATANIFEPERSKERLSWVKTTVLMDIMSSFFHSDVTSSEERKTFICEFLDGHMNKRAWDSMQVGNGNKVVRILSETLDHLSLDVHGQDIKCHLNHAWKEWVEKWEGEEDSREVELLVRTILLSSGHSSTSHDIFSHPHFHSLLALTNSICYHLRLYHKAKVCDDNGNNNRNIESSITTPEIESKMQQLVQLVLDNSLNHIDPKIKNIFLDVAKSFYYMAYFDDNIIDFHVSKVLFERVQ